MKTWGGKEMVPGGGGGVYRGPGHKKLKYNKKLYDIACKWYVKQMGRYPLKILWGHGFDKTSKITTNIGTK